MNVPVNNADKGEKRREQSEADAMQTKEDSNNGMCMCLQY